MIKKGIKKQAKQNSTINFGMIRESELVQGVIITVINTALQITYKYVLDSELITLTIFLQRNYTIVRNNLAQLYVNLSNNLIKMIFGVHLVSDVPQNVQEGLWQNLSNSAYLLPLFARINFCRAWICLLIDAIKAITDFNTSENATSSEPATNEY
jgi:hypothetical protein